MNKITQNTPSHKEEETGIGGSVEKYLRKYIRADDVVLPSSGLYHRIIEEVEKPVIKIALEICKGNQNKAAHLLGINRNTLRKKISEHKLDTELVKCKKK